MISLTDRFGNALETEKPDSGTGRSCGCRPHTKGRAEMYARDVPVECGGVHVEPGDLVFGDADGVVVVPQAIANNVLKQAMDKISSEELTRRDLLAGRSLREVFELHGVL